MSEREIIIKVDKLYKRYGKFVAVNNISFSVYKGEIFGLLGPNGAGKTTTIEIIETLREKTSGKVELDGYDIDKSADKIRSIIGVQLQHAGFYPSLTLSELLDLFAGLYDVKIDKGEVLERVGLRDKQNEIFTNLSGGQKQRFSISTTIINSPKVIFLDEPTTGLDPQARRNLWELIRTINASGTTIILTTHYLDEAEELCDRVAIIDGGEIKKLDSPNNLIDELVATGFTKPKSVKAASLEDVFLYLTGKELREE